MTAWHRAIDRMERAIECQRFERWHMYVGSVRMYQHHIDWEPRWWAWIACIPGLPDCVFHGVPRLLRWKMQR